MRLVTAKHSLMTSFENERALKFLECLVPAHIVPYLLSVPRKDIVERLDMETVMFMVGTKVSFETDPFDRLMTLGRSFHSRIFAVCSLLFCPIRFSTSRPS